MFGLLSLYAVLQVILESLPISSSGHLELVNCWCIKHGCTVELSRTFEYLLHGPTLLMLIAYSAPWWWLLARHAWLERRRIITLILYVAGADAITTVIYTLLQCMVCPHVPLWLGFCVTGILLWSLRWCPGMHDKSNEALYDGLSLHTLCLLGVVQGLAGLPGVSRFASTYVAGRWLGLAPRKSLFVSILLQWPLMFGGFMLGVVHAPFEPQSAWFAEPSNLVLLAVCAGIAYFVLWAVQILIERERLWWLAPYLAIPATLTLLWC